MNPEGVKDLNAIFRNISVNNRYHLFLLVFQFHDFLLKLWQNERGNR